MNTNYIPGKVRRKNEPGPGPRGVREVRRSPCPVWTSEIWCRGRGKEGLASVCLTFTVSAALLVVCLAHVIIWGRQLYDVPLVTLLHQEPCGTHGVSWQGSTFVGRSEAVLVARVMGVGGFEGGLWSPSS